MVATSAPSKRGAVAKPNSIDMKRVPRSKSCSASFKEVGVAFRTRSKRKRKEITSTTCSGSAKKAKSEEADVPCCGICLDTVSERGVLDSCEHIFCYSCLKTWLHRSSSCPHCKRQVHTVTRRGKDDSVCVEKIEKRVLRETLEREESASVGRVVLVGQVNMNRMMHSRPMMYDDANLFNVLLGVRNDSPPASQGFRVLPNTRSAVQSDPVMYPGASVRQNPNRYNVASLPASRPLANSVFGNVQPALNTPSLQTSVTGQNYLQHCHFQIGHLVRSQFLQSSSSLPARDVAGGVSFLPYVGSNPGYSPNHFPPNNHSWPVHHQRGMVEIQRPSMCLPYRYPIVRRDNAGFAQLGVHNISPASLGSPF